MDGIFGWLGRNDAHETLIREMHRAARPSPDAECALHGAADFGIGACARFGKATSHIADALAVALHGRPRFADDDLARLARERGPAAAVAEGWARHGASLPTRLLGTFAIAVVEPEHRRVSLVLDRVGAERLCYAQHAEGIAFGTSVQSVAAHPRVGRTIDLQAIYDYLYFHTIPAPRSLYQGVRKLLPGQIVTFEGGRLGTAFYWHADYTPVAARFDARRATFRHLLDASVRDADAPGTAAFLSGGTDSSTVVGALTGARAAPVDTFSIGFDAEGFDEMDYARCAAERFGSRRNEYYLAPDDIVTAIPVIAGAYDEPFGNDSAVPTYFCAKAAREAGFTRMLAGDGGDEIFGGNARYAKQRLFEAYGRIPAALRHGVIEPLANLPGLSAHFPLSKLRSYVTQARIGLPLRLESYNFLHRTPLDDILEPDFLHAIDPAATDAALTEVYARTVSDHYINRMMHVDLKFTLADNDLRKVGTMTEAAGVEVRYPLLDDRMVAFANRLPPNFKVRGQQLRWFFKAALDDLLPEKIIKKRKHGFGLPFGVWSTRHAPLGEIVGDSLADLKQRGWVRPAYLDRVGATLHGPHASYYGVMVWVMMMLERWLAASED